MATAFEEYIQLELPKRPYLATDVPVESVIIRRGAGPRELNSIVLDEGQTVVYRGGELVAEAVSSGAAIDSISHSEPVASTQWVINHGKTNRSVVVTLLDSNYEGIIPDKMVITDDTITVDFIENQSGFANIVFLPA